MPAAILYDNLADAGTITASSWIAAAPPSMLQNAHVSRRWKGRSADTEHVLVDLGELMTVDTACLFGCQYVQSDGTQVSMDANAVTQVRFSTADATGMAGDAHDSGSAAGRIAEEYGSLCYYLEEPVECRYVRIDLSQAGASALLAGRLVVGLRSEFEVNFSYGWNYGWEDLSRQKKVMGGGTFVELDSRYRVLTVTFNFVSEDERYGFVWEADRVGGSSRDVLVCLDPLSDDPGRDSVWGLMKNKTPPSQPNFSFFAVTYNIEERL